MQFQRCGGWISAINRAATSWCCDRKRCNLSHNLQRRGGQIRAINRAADTNSAASPLNPMALATQAAANCGNTPSQLSVHASTFSAPKAVPANRQWRTRPIGEALLRTPRQQRRNNHRPQRGKQTGKTDGGDKAMWPPQRSEQRRQKCQAGGLQPRAGMPQPRRSAMKSNRPAVTPRNEAITAKCENTDIISDNARTCR